MKLFSILFFLSSLTGFTAHAGDYELTVPVAAMAGLRENAENNYSSENPQKACPQYLAPGVATESFNKLLNSGSLGGSQEGIQH
jgi:hypothetical protein